MVRGLTVFAEAFRDHLDQYILIGGTACEVLFESAGQSFRATKDLDIVLATHALTPAYVERFWSFIEAGGYQSHERSEQPLQFYRFKKPSDPVYPAMIELFSRHPANLPVRAGAHLTPVPVPGHLQSLSAILLDDYYEAMLRTGRLELDGLSIASPPALLLLKARAWLDLRARRDAGESQLSAHIRKHRNDVLRLFTLLDPENVPQPAPPIKADLARFLDAMREEEVVLGDLGIQGIDRDALLTEVSSLFKL